MKKIILFSILALILIFGCVNPEEKKKDVDTLKELYKKYIQFGTDGEYVSMKFKRYEGENYFIKEFKNGGIRKYYALEKPIYKEEVFFTPEGNFVCLSYKGVKECIQSNESQLFSAIAKRAASEFLSPSFFKKQEKIGKRILERDGLVFLSGPENKTYEGRKCTEFSYIINYSKFSLDDFSYIGKNPNSIEVKYYKDFISYVCIDPETGEWVHNKLKYTIENETRTTEVQYYYIDLKRKEINEEELPLTNNTEILEKSFEEAQDLERDVERCYKDKKNFDQCISLRALETRYPELCEYISKEKKELCKFRIYTYYKDSKGCEGLEELRDSCYLEIAKKSNNTQLCNNIEEEKLREECLSLNEENQSE